MYGCEVFPYLIGFNKARTITMCTESIFGKRKAFPMFLYSSL